MKLYCPITIDLYKVYPLQVMEAQQGNVGRGAIVTLTAGSAVIDPTDETVEVYAKKPDGTVSWLECSVEDAKVKINFTNQMLMSPGVLQVELRFKNENEDITTPIFTVNVNKSNVQSAGRSKNELPVLDEVKEEISKLLEAIANLKLNGTGSGNGLTVAVKTALLNCFKNVAWTVSNGQDYYNALETALNASGSGGEVEPDIPDTPVTYTITRNLTNCKSSKSTTTITGGSTYTESITANSGYTLTGATVSVTMGGTNISSSYSNGILNISSVTGNIVITVVAVKEATEPDEPEVTLSSISATYTGGDVVVGTSVNSLSGITVKAHYSDGSTSNVTGYTLSGTIAEGSNTITVSYGGKTTTFTVTGVAESGGEETGVSNEITWTDGVPYTYTSISGYVEKTDGSFTDHSTWHRTPYLYCENASKLRVSLRTANSQMGTAEVCGNNAFYDKDKNFIESFSFLGIDQATVGSYVDIEIPDNAVYFVASGKSAFVTTTTDTRKPYAEITPIE